VHCSTSIGITLKMVVRVIINDHGNFSLINTIKGL
jgi:hypothetical protein